MKSLLSKNFLIYALVVLISFIVLGLAFVYQVDRYAEEERTELASVLSQRAAEATAGYFAINDSLHAGPGSAADILLSAYKINMCQLAAEADGKIFVSDGSGELIYIVTARGCYGQNGGELPEDAADAIADDGRYTAKSDFSGYMSSLSFLDGRSVTDRNLLRGMVVVAIPAQRYTALTMEMVGTFLAMTVVVLLLTVAATFMVSNQLVKPIRQMTAAASAFGRGDYSIRVNLPKRRDELYDLTRSFNTMADDIQNNERMRRELVANVSHDLRTPMTTIGGFVDGMLDGTIKPEQQKYYLEIISGEVKRLARLASGLLEVSRFEEGSRPLNKTVFDVSEMLRRIVIGFSRELEEKNIDFALDIPDTLNISADHDGIFQVVYNLFDNALKFVEQNGTITIFMSAKSGRLSFNILNSGAEIAPEDQKHIFNQFYKGDRSRTESRKGSGLGLYIVKTIINRHGGDVAVKSGGGRTEFFFTIPI